MSMLRMLFFAFLALAVLTVIILICTILWYRKMKASSIVNSETDGLITKIVSRNYKDSDDGLKKTSHTLYVTYHVNGRELRTQMALRDKEQTYQEGQSVTVLYDESFPRHAYVKGDPEPPPFLMNYLALAILFAFLSVSLLIFPAPYLLGFTKSQKDVYDIVLKSVFFLLALSAFILYPRTSDYKKEIEKRRKVGKKFSPTRIVALLVTLDTGFDIAFYIVFDLILK